MAAARALGFLRLLDYAQSRPTSTYEELAVALGEVAGRKFAPVQVDMILQSEAKTIGEIEYYLKSSLLRRFREMMPQGWVATGEYNPQLARALAAWSSRLPEHYTNACRKVFDKLLKLRFKEAWLPDNTNDPILTQVFQESNFSYHSLHVLTAPSKLD
jgi:hypothetical protein